MLERWRAGETKQGIPTRSWNAFCDTADIVLGNAPPGQKFPVNPATGLSSRLVLPIQNDTTEEIPAGTPVAAGRMVAEPREPRNRVSTPTLEYIPPDQLQHDDDYSCFGVAEQAIKAKSLGPIVVRGPVWTKIHYSRHVQYDPFVSFALFGEGEDLKLQLANNGFVGTGRGRILEVALSDDIEGPDLTPDEGVIELWALVNLGEGRGLELVLLYEDVPGCDLHYLGGVFVSLVPGIGEARKLLPGGHQDYREVPAAINGINGVAPVLGLRPVTEAAVTPQTVLVVNPFATAVDVTPGKGRIAQLYDGILQNVDCAEIDDVGATLP